MKGAAGNLSVVALSACLAFFSSAARAACGAVDRAITSEEFASVLDAVAQGWNSGDAAHAASCFTQDALYVEPPQKQVFEGRQALFSYFGGEAGRAGEMTMIWRMKAFDEETQTGAAEFSFTYGATAHGVAVIHIRDGLIESWREYWKESALDWPAFIAPANK